MQAAPAKTMEERKEKEIAHYDRLAREWREHTAIGEAGGDIELTDVMRMKSYRALYQELASRVPGKRVLDYGCGHGMHAEAIAKMGAKEVVGIDLSEESLAIARERVRHASIESKVSFRAMDAERLEFPENSFDVVFDGGTFSSIDIAKAYEQIARVLRSGGYLIGIETLGHHPLANLKRWLNKKRGVRTAWAAAHIMKMEDLKTARDYFEPKKILFFHLLGLLALPFSRLPGGTLLVSFADALDRVLFAIFPFLKRYGFKVVFVFKKK
ncbi:MAG: class I SAM-dependent methyltransferase [bacterium]|nr:class I SAM-dependent methyltransferase [bacterium]